MILLAMVGGAEVAILIVLGFLALLIFFNLSMQATMAALQPQNRKMAPGLIWLNLIPIPFANAVFTLIYCVLLCGSINQQAGKNVAPTALAVLFPSIGIVYLAMTLMLESINYSSRGQVAGVSVFFFLGSLVCFILFWVQVVAARKALSAEARSSDDILDG